MPDLCAQNSAILESEDASETSGQTGAAGNSEEPRRRSSLSQKGGKAANAKQRLTATVLEYDDSDGYSAHSSGRSRNAKLGRKLSNDSTRSVSEVSRC